MYSSEMLVTSAKEIILYTRNGHYFTVYLPTDQQLWGYL